MSYEKQAEIAYSGDTDRVRSRAMASGRAIDNCLRKEYGSEGATNCRFNAVQYEAYFSPEALGKRVDLLLPNC